MVILKKSSILKFLPLLTIIIFILIAVFIGSVVSTRKNDLRASASITSSIQPESGVLVGNVQIVDESSTTGPRYTLFTSSIQPTPTTVATLPLSCATSYKRLIKVASTSQLTSAITSAIPGDMIVMADGLYNGRIDILRPGTVTDRITLCGGRGATITGTTLSGGDVIALKTNYWNLAGFKVTNAIQGVTMKNASFNRISDLEIYGIGQAAIHAHVFSSDNTFENNYIHDTGKYNAEYGEGIYIGTANTQWSTYTNGSPDKSDRNKMISNVFGSNVTAENIDIKEGTSYGEIRNNTFNGVGQSTSPDFLDSWVDIKGSHYTVTENTGTKARRYGFEVNKQVTKTDSGDYNSFSRNVMNLSGGQYGIKVGYNSPIGTVVSCSNTVTNATSGLSNIPCQP